VSAQSVAAIQRGLLGLDREGGSGLFGEPALELTDLLRTDLNGRGVISIMAADQLVLRPRLYSSFLLWLLSELFERLPEVGDLEKPRLVFVFDEAHLLFDDAPPALRQRVEQVVRIITLEGRVSTSAPNSRTTSRTRSSVNSATTFSTHCEPTPRPESVRTAGDLRPQRSWM
jgi:DNA helicase HerA-like ATPase